MTYINCGVRDKAGVRIPTKAMLKRLLKEDPSQLVFDKTSPFNGTGNLTTDDLEPGLVFTVCGPDPYRERRWWSSVKLGKKGPVAD